MQGAVDGLRPGVMGSFLLPLRAHRQLNGWGGIPRGVGRKKGWGCQPAFSQENEIVIMPRCSGGSVAEGRGAA